MSDLHGVKKFVLHAVNRKVVAIQRSLTSIGQEGRQGQDAAKFMKSQDHIAKTFSSVLCPYYKKVLTIKGFIANPQVNK